MAINTYTALKDEINNYLARSDLTADADTFIDLAEERLCRDIRLRATEATMNVTLVNGVAAIPSDYVQMKHVFISGSPTQPLEVKEATWPQFHLRPLSRLEHLRLGWAVLEEARSTDDGSANE
jgi:hypothetical protein